MLKKNAFRESRKKSSRSIFMPEAFFYLIGKGMHRSDSKTTKDNKIGDYFPPLSTLELLLFQNSASSARSSAQHGSHQQNSTKKASVVNHLKCRENVQSSTSQANAPSVGAAPLDATTLAVSYLHQTLLSPQPLQHEEQTGYSNHKSQIQQQNQLVRPNSNIGATANLDTMVPSHVSSTSLAVGNSSMALGLNAMLPQHPVPNVTQSTTGFQSSQQGLLSGTITAEGATTTTGQYQSLPLHQQQQQQPMLLHHVPTSFSFQHSISATTVPLPVHSSLTAVPLPIHSSAALEIDGRKRARAATTASTTSPLYEMTTAIPAPPPLPSSSYLLHQACRLYAQTPAVIECALKADPQSANRRFLSESQQSRKKRGRSLEYLYPINIALEHNASLPVLQLLARAAPDVLVQPDGPEASSTIAVAISCLEDAMLASVLRLLVECNPKCVSTRDCKGNYPLHNACAKTRMSSATIRKIVQAHPPALQAKNFHGQRPLDIAQRCGGMSCDDIVDCLQQMAYDGLERNACHLHDDSDQEE